MISMGFIGNVNNWFINLGRYFVAAASIVTIFASGFLIFAGIWQLFNGLPEIVNLLFFQKEFQVELPVLFISAIDSFMVAVVMFVLGIGLYKLFVNENTSANTLKWFVIYDLYDLKEKLIATSV
ncbi:MAG: YqhA family protein, partial [Candidatus Brocadia sp.]